MKKSNPKIVAVQPKSYRGEEEHKNLEECLGYIDKATDEGADIVAFPEGYPGPYHGPVSYSPIEDICEKAKERGIYVVFGMIEEAGDDQYYLSLKLAAPDGEVGLSYYRVQPNEPEVDDVLIGKPIKPGSSLKTYEMEFGTLGFLICSEIWCPELVRVLALRGIDILFVPIGALVYELFEPWKNVLWTRAIENHIYVVTSPSLYGKEDGIAMIAGPEEVLAERTDLGMIMAEANLDRLKWLRSHTQTLEIPKKYKSIPGLLRYRRPEFYEELVQEQEDSLFSDRD